MILSVREPAGKQELTNTEKKMIWPDQLLGFQYALLTVSELLLCAEHGP